MNELCEMKRILILDGGFGSQISKKINVSIDEDVLWSARLLATNTEAVINTHLDFLQAGSNVISTNTYQASIDGFVQHLNLNEQESFNLIKEAVALAKRAVNIYNTRVSKEKKNILIAGSVGPYGACLHDGSEYTGNYKDSVTSTKLTEWHEPRIKALIQEGVDLLAFETLPCKKEAEVLLNILKKYPETKAWLSFNCKNGTSIASGENFQTTAAECYKINQDQLVAVGVNCVSPVYIEQLFYDINANLKECPIPLIVYPNSGESYNIDKGWCGLGNCKPVETYVDKWLDMGITWLGGCCRMYSDDISKIKHAVENWKMKESYM